IRSSKDDLAYANLPHLFKLAAPLTVNEDATKFGTTIWSNAAVTELLAQYGLPPSSPLSVLCVEILPHITSLFEHVSALSKQNVRDKMRTMVGSAQFPTDGVIAEELATRSVALKSINFDEDRPLNDQLGNYRILRTSPLRKVPFGC